MGVHFNLEFISMCYVHNHHTSGDLKICKAFFNRYHQEQQGQQSSLGEHQIFTVLLTSPLNSELKCIKDRPKNLNNHFQSWLNCAYRTSNETSFRLILQHLTPEDLEILYDFSDIESILEHIVNHSDLRYPFAETLAKYDKKVWSRIPKHKLESPENYDTSYVNNIINMLSKINVESAYAIFVSINSPVLFRKALRITGNAKLKKRPLILARADLSPINHSFYSNI